MDDLILLIAGGTDTTAHTIAATLYFLSKNPSALTTLRSELSENNLSDKSSFSKNCTLDTLHNCTYLTSVIKETMRLDTIAPASFIYSSNRDIQICDVPIPKGLGIRIDLISSKFDETHFLNPDEYIPERFDVDSEFYKKSKKMGKTPEAYSVRAFSVGNRACPGQSLAMLESKVMLAFFVSFMNWKFTQEDLDNTGFGFGIGTDFHPKVEVTER